jgi:hypothetical protein
VGSISSFETATKVSLGKLPHAEWIARAFVTPCADFDFIELSVNNAHACRFRVPVGHVARPSAGPRPPAGFCRVYVKVIGKFP